MKQHAIEMETLSLLLLDLRSPRNSSRSDVTRISDTVDVRRLAVPLAFGVAVGPTTPEDSSLSTSKTTARCYRACCGFFGGLGGLIFPSSIIFCYLTLCLASRRFCTFSRACLIIAFLELPRGSNS